MIKINELPKLETLRKLFNYDENSPSGLCWLKETNIRKYGKYAGSIHSNVNNGYKTWIVYVDKKLFPIHRIVWSLCNNQIIDTKYQIDHINRNPLDNRIENLRLTNSSRNVLNVNVKSNNTSGFTGVHYDKAKNKWISCISINKVKIRSGLFDTIEQAICCRLDDMIKYYPDYVSIQILSIKEKYPEIFKKYENFLNDNENNTSRNDIIEHNKILDRKIEQNNINARIEKQLKYIKDIVNFIHTYKRPPYKESKDEIEKRLGVKLNALRRIYNTGNTYSGVIYKETLDYLNSIHMIDILNYKDVKQLQMLVVKEILEFLITNKKLPRNKCKQSDEKRLGQRLNQLKYAYNNPIKSTYKIYDETMEYLKSINMEYILYNIKGA